MNAYNEKIFQNLSKLSDTQIEKLFESMSSRQEMLFSIFESLATGLIILDKQGKFLMVNKAALRYIPFSVYPDESRFDSQTQCLWEMIRDEEIAEFLKSCCEGEKVNVSEEFSTQASNGSTRFILITINPLVQNEKLVGSIIVVRDITKSRNQEILLHRMESLASLTNLAASVAHEIKNPLGAISIHIQLLQKAIKKAREGDGLLPDEKFIEKYLDVVNEEIDNLNKIVMDFLFAVRPVSANLELLNPNKLLEKIKDFFAPEFEEKKVALELKLCDNNVRLMLDEKLFREVIINLAQNALAALLEKYHGTSENQDGAINQNRAVNQDAFDELNGKPCLTIETALKDDKFFVLVKDNGTGMDEKTLSHIFEPYYTTKANGTGLGLTMVYKIIKEFSGDIQAQSEEGKGTAFVISIPVPQTDKKLIASSAQKTDKAEK